MIFLPILKHYRTRFVLDIPLLLLYLWLQYCTTLSSVILIMKDVFHRVQTEKNDIVVELILTLIISFFVVYTNYLH